jgi:hypothetical protein
MLRRGYRLSPGFRRALPVKGGERLNPANAVGMALMLIAAAVVLRR